MTSLRDRIDRYFDLGMYAVTVVVISAIAGWCTAFIGGETISLIDAAIIDGSGQPAADRDRNRVAAVLDAARELREFGEQNALKLQPETVSVTSQQTPIRRPAVSFPADDPAAKYHDGGEDTYRTFCVRLCDGYFWPVSFSTTSDSFDQDQATCASSCNSPARLFVHKMPGGNAGTMKSLDGLPYTALKTAFLFRTSYDSQCKCRPQPWDQQALDRHRLYAVAQAASKGSRTAAEEARVLAAKLAAQAQQDSSVLATANDRTNRELAILARSEAAETAKSNKRGTAFDRVAEARRDGGVNIMRLGAVQPSSTKTRWVPASGSNRHWKDKVFGGN